MNATINHREAIQRKAIDEYLTKTYGENFF